MTTYGSSKDGDHKDFLDSFDIDKENDFVIPKLEFKKVHILLKGKEGVTMSIPNRDQPQCKFCQSHCNFL